MTNFSIKDLSHFSGIKPHTIRIWEQRFSFLQPGRNESFRRLYSVEQLNVFLDASFLNKNGFKVSRIARMTPEERVDVVSRLDQSQLQAKSIHDLIIYMAEMDAEGFERVLDKNIRDHGIHEVIQNIILPFAERVGLFQKIDSKSYIENIAVIQECLKRKMHLGMEQLNVVKKKDKSVLLFLPQAESQEVFLLYLNYLLLKEGYRVMNLGRIPMDILRAVTLYKKPDYLISYLLEKSGRKELAAFANQMDAFSPKSQLVTVGTNLSLVRQEHYRNIAKLENLLLALA